MDSDTTWWKSGIVYQIYPRSFQDDLSNPDGIGDLKGLIKQLDYLNDGTSNSFGNLKSLGIDAIWLSPFFPSPMADFGYDISDYTDIDPVFGNMGEFETLIREAHKRGIRIILDLVVNHSSDRHPWFQQSCDTDSDKSDWYIWHPGREGGKKPPNNWLGCFGGRGWTYHPKRQAWYYHSFLSQQPDLNWRNPDVKQAIKNVMTFWLDKGVDGFRLDVVNLYFKDAQLRDNPTRKWKIARPYDRQIHQHDRDQPEMHELLKEMRSWLDAYSVQGQERFMVGEVMLEQEGNSALPASYYGQQTGINDQLNLAFNFEFLHSPFTAESFKRIIKNWTKLLGENGDNWPNYTLSNHDFVRNSSRYAVDGSDGDITQARLKLLAMMLLTLRGTPFLYYGEELGMPEQKVKRKEMQDPLGIKYWPLHNGRDGCRRPMMWSENIQAFSPVASWLPNAPIAPHTVEQQQKDPDSLLNWYKKLIALRKAESALHSGNFDLLDSEKDVIHYQRSCPETNSTFNIALNFSVRSRKVMRPTINDTEVEKIKIINGHLVDGHLSGLGCVISTITGT